MSRNKKYADFWCVWSKILGFSFIIYRDVIAVNQDFLGIQGKRLQVIRNVEVSFKFCLSKPNFLWATFFCDVFAKFFWSVHILLFGFLFWCENFSSVAKIGFRFQVWVKPISPVLKGTFSYAVAWASKRDDGAPYSIQTALSKLGLVHEDGYFVTVRTFQ